jgi:diaminopimelate epimerase
MEFVKMHGIGNDFVLIDGRTFDMTGINLAEMAKKLCDRNFGIGADGLLIVLPSDKADVRMRVINPDGSEPEMCGNGIRCFAKFVYEKMDKKKELISVETLAGIMIPSIIEHKGKIAIVEVDMEKPREILGARVKVQGTEYKATLVNMGNPHCVIFTEDVNTIDLAEIGPLIENDKMFPNRTNVEFVQVISKKEIVVKVWERGAGETLACGTGACASVVAGIEAKKLDRNVIVRLPGGILNIEWQQDGHVILRGPAETVYEGKI